MTPPHWWVGPDGYGQDPPPVRAGLLDRTVGQTALRHQLAPALIESRNYLLNALDALSNQSQALTVIGAQAVHERSSALKLQSTSTTDGDLAVSPELFADCPTVADALRKAGYCQRSQDRPGIWVSNDRDNDSVDLLVPETFAGNGRRAARTRSDHGRNAIGRAAGIELATFDRDQIELASFDLSRSGRTAWVAGTAALLVAKSYKLIERINARDAGKPNRVKPKDAGDIVRLMLSSDPGVVGDTIRKFADDHAAVAQTARTGRAYLVRLFGLEDEGAYLAAQDLVPQMSEKEIAQESSDWISTFVGHTRSLA